MDLADYARSVKCIEEAALQCVLEPNRLWAVKKNHSDDADILATDDVNRDPRRGRIDIADAQVLKGDSPNVFIARAVTGSTPLVPPVPPVSTGIGPCYSLPGV